MRADVLQAVAIACHSCAFLAGESARPPEILSGTSFGEVHEIQFERKANGKLAPGVIADSIGPWLKKLAKEGVIRLEVSLAICPWNPFDAISEPWGILTDGDVGVEVWQPAWKKRIRSHSDPAPWGVMYSASRSGRWAVHAAYSLCDASKLLRSAVAQTSSSHPLLAALQGDSPPSSDVFPATWPAERRGIGGLAARTLTLLRSEEWARVLFSGGLSPAAYESVSRRLWAAAIMALEASANLRESAAERPRGPRSHQLTG
ncbi:MAG TPA: hypothetical protein VMI31_13970 [Fimbriimonadaceae bacterium]|nr:hypothetical protein [Fimbriimonadaceae bacterium]